MSKKILASLLAVASILSVSAVAFAEGGDEETVDDGTVHYTGSESLGSYTVTDIGVGYGTVNVQLPKAMDGIMINPYGAAVKTESNSAKNKNFVASPVYEVKNNDTNDGIKVYATTQVTKVSGLVVVDANAKKPVGWDNDTTNDENKIVGAQNGKDWNPLYTYDKLTAKTDKSAKTTTYTGGAFSTKQGNNVGIKVVGAKEAADATDYTATTNTVSFLPKGTNTDIIGYAAKSSTLYYSICGELSDQAPAAAPTYAWGKEKLSLSVVLKIIPIDNSDVPTT